jgi:hypothetical protein
MRIADYFPPNHHRRGCSMEECNAPTIKDQVDGSQDKGVVCRVSTCCDSTSLDPRTIRVQLVWNGLDETTC